MYPNLWGSLLLAICVNTRLVPVRLTAERMDW